LKKISQLSVIFSFWFAFLPFFSWGTVALANPGDAELLQAQADLLIQDGKTTAALDTIDKALIISPNDLKLLELKALTLNQLGNWKAAFNLYDSLSDRSQATPKKRAPYEFELGLIEFKQKNFKNAEKHFLFALNQRFNLDVSQFLLGSIYLGQKSFIRAQEYLKASLDSPVKELKAQSHMYLGQSFAEQGNYPKAFKHVVAARELASELSTASDARQANLGSQILESTNALAGQLGKSNLIAQVGLITGYDSNVLLNPTSNADPASQSASLKETLSFSLQYLTPPDGGAQWQLLYQGAVNYNFNSATRAGQFAINDLAANVTLNPEESTRYGVRAGAQYILRSGADGSSTANSFANYSLIGTVGTFVYHDEGKGTILGAEILVQPQSFLRDSDSPTSYRKTGWGGIARFYRQGNRFLGMNSPLIALVFDLRQTTGEEFRSKSVGLEFGGNWKVSSRFTILPQTLFSYTAYQFRETGYRGDWFLNGQLASQFKVANGFFLNSSLQVGKNFSTVIDTYEYFRFAASIGINYQF